MGRVTSVTLADSLCTVLVNEGEVPAFLTDQVWSFVEVGAVVTILPVGDTFQVIATQGSSAGAGGTRLGPELLPNNGFEYGPSGLWGLPTNWSIEWDYTTGEPEPAHWDNTVGGAAAGTGFARVDIVAGTWTHGMTVLPENPVAVDPGVTYTASAWLKASNNTSGLVMRLKTYTADTAANCWEFGTGRVSTDLAVITNPGAAYQFVTGNVTVPAGHHFARTVLRTEAPNGAVVVASWDEPSLRQRIH